MEQTSQHQQQYLSKDILISNIIKINVKPEDLGSSDTYNESKILSSYLKLSNDSQILIYKAAIQLAIIGYGNKNYGFIRIDDKTVLKLEDLFKKLNIKFIEKQGARFNDDDLSARRLLRLFRHHIQQFIIDNNRPSYLYTKYSDKNLKYMSICFPGGEHLVETEDEAVYLYNTYETLDKVQGTKFSQRLQRVYIARGILPPEYFITK